MRHSKKINYEELKAETQEQYDGWQAYGRSKLSNILSAKALATRFPVSTSGVAFFSLHPGLVATNLLVVGGVGGGMGVDDGIKCTMWVATEDGLATKSGTYFHNEVSHFIEAEGRANLMAAVASDQDEATACWTQSLAMLQLEETAFGKPPKIPANED